jgi:predicted RND superfamily exporter protein
VDTAFSRRFVAWTVRHGLVLWVAALLLAVPAAWRTAGLYAHLRSELEELLPRESPSVRAIDELRARMPGLQYLAVVVDTGTPENVEPAERFLDDLAARVRTYPSDLQRAVYLGDGDERAFLEKHAALYTELDDLRTIRARIEARRDWEVAKEQGASLDDDDGAAPPLDFTDVEKKYDARLPHGAPGGAPGDRYANAQKRTAAMLVEVGAFTTSGATAGKLLERVQADARALDVDKYAPGMRVGYAGDAAISHEELSALVTDLSVSSVLVLVAVVGAILVYYRWPRSVVALGAPLLLATVYSFAIASLPPFGVTELNSNTAFLGSIIVGNGINFGIVLLARYVEERRAGRAVQESMAIAITGSRVGTLSAALAAGVSYASLVVTQFRGFRQFGIIGGLGMVLAWVCAFVLTPPLVAWLDRDARHAPRPAREESRWIPRLARVVVGRPRMFALGGAVLVALAAVQVRGFSGDRLEHDFSQLRRADTWTKGEGYWGGRLDDLLGRYLTPTVILARDADDARAIAGRVRREIARPPLSEMVDTVRTLDDVLPQNQGAKLEEARAIREDMTPKMRSLVAPEKRDQIDKLLGDEDPQPVALGDLPRRFTTALVERDGTAGRTVLVYPKQTKALWQGQAIEAYARTLREAAGPEARVAGSLPLSADILSSVRHDGPIATGVAFAGVVLVVVLLFRGRMTTLYVVGALLTGVLWLAAATIALGVKINFANFIAFPITFGIGVDYAVNVMSRYAQVSAEERAGPARVAQAVGSTGSAVALCSLTTIIGYSSLLLAENRALFLFGVVAVLGEVACLTAALTCLPALLAWVEGARRAEADRERMGAAAGTR